MKTSSLKPLFFQKCGCFKLYEVKKYFFFLKNNYFYAVVIISQNFLVKLQLQHIIKERKKLFFTKINFIKSGIH